VKESEKGARRDRGKGKGGEKGTEKGKEREKGRGALGATDRAGASVPAEEGASDVELIDIARENGAGDASDCREQQGQGAGQEGGMRGGRGRGKGRGKRGKSRRWCL